MAMLQMGSRGSEVTNLQGGLNKALPQIMPPLVTDGAFGMKTRDRVIRFQQAKGLKADGIAGPKTLGTLAASVPTGPGAPPMAPGVPLPPPGPPAVGAMKFKTEMMQEFEKKGKGIEFGKYLDDLEKDRIPGWKNFLGTISRAEEARQLASFWIELNHMLRGVEDQKELVLRGIAKLNKNDLEIFEALSKPTGSIGKIVSALGSAATIAGYLVTIIECVQHARKGEPGPIATELYKFAMGKAVPWAAIIEGVGSLLDGTVPEHTRKNSQLFKILRAVDPIGMGGVAIDSVVSITTSGFEMVARGRVDVDILTNRLTPLVARMKQGPANIFVELGENSGDALYELTQTDIDVNAMLRYSWMELTDWIKKAGSDSAPMGGVRRGTI